MHGLSGSAAAPSGGLSVTLASNNKAVTLPDPRLTVPANATSAGLATRPARFGSSSAQAATLTATANGTGTKTFALQLGTEPSTAALVVQLHHRLDDHRRNRHLHGLSERRSTKWRTQRDPRQQ